MFRQLKTIIRVIRQIVESYKLMQHKLTMNNESHNKQIISEYVVDY